MEALEAFEALDCSVDGLLVTWWSPVSGVLVLAVVVVVVVVVVMVVMVVMVVVMLYVLLGDLHTVQSSFISGTPSSEFQTTHTLNPKTLNPKP